ncbi:HET-domain-containing protein [Nemania sp. FL0031]|nr:HET-domain-containing protein [Nemania sp. FL0031]
MRFINTTSLRFREVSDLEIHRLRGGYCILSHRWGDDEISYADMFSMDDAVKAKASFGKLKGACDMAKRLGYDLLWIDTCCINKVDAAELSEAINSMYRWYSISSVCIAYLQDAFSAADVKQSEWFARGWTLQELIAPETVNFYGRGWNFLGDKKSLSSEIASRTGIPKDVLSKKIHPQACSVAQRMSWAAKRTTKRLEDRAYSLMGLFDVNMPMIYGERDRAFLRLQEHIISKSSDESIFIWDLDILEDSTRDAKQVHCGLLAPSPACFARSGDVVSLGRSRGFHINQFGLAISLPAIQRGLGTFQATLNVGRAGKSGQCAIFLVELPEGELYARRSTSSGESTFLTKKVRSTRKDFTIPLELRELPPHLYPGFWLRKLGFHDPRITSHKVLRRIESESKDRIRLPDYEFGTAGIIRLTLRNEQDPARFGGLGWIKLGFNSESRPVCFISFPERDASGNHSSWEMSNQVIEMMATPTSAGNQALLKHPIFDDAWTNITPQALAALPSNSYDSRKVAGNLDRSFSFTFKAPLFDISVSVTRVPDMNYAMAGGRGEVWAVDLVAGTPPVTHRVENNTRYENESECCC